MNTTRLHEAIAAARDEDSPRPDLSFMTAAAELLEEHELRLSILSTYIIPERCKPQAGDSILPELAPLCPTCLQQPEVCKCGPAERDSSLAPEEIDTLLKATETDVTDEKWEWEEGSQTEESAAPPQAAARHALTGRPYDQPEGNAELGGSLDALRTRPGTDGACPECASLRAQHRALRVAARRVHNVWHHGTSAGLVDALIGLAAALKESRDA